MSDLSKTNAKEEEEFNSHEYFKMLCADNKITVSRYAKIQFLAGWKSLVDKFFCEIKGYSIIINGITDTYMVLDINFEVVNRTREVNVWRAINFAREQSKKTCANCGEFKRYDKSENGPSLFCYECSKKTINKYRTGTWLDRY